MKNGIQLIADERDRQLSKGFDAAHDDAHTDGTILDAANWIMSDLDHTSAYWSNAAADDPGASWPEKLATHVREKYGDDKLRRLVIAGAMIVAEINRLQRKAAKEPA